MYPLEAEFPPTLSGLEHPQLLLKILIKIKATKFRMIPKNKSVSLMLDSINIQP